MKHVRSVLTPTAAFLRRVGIYGALILVALLVQSSLAYFELFRYAVPAIVFAVVSAIGFFDSERSGAVAGIFAGWALDAVGGSQVVILPVVGLLIGYLSGIAAGRWLPRGILPFALVLLVTDFFSLLSTIICVLIGVPDVSFGVLLLHTLLPELLFSFLFGLPFALLTRGITQGLRPRIP